MTPKDHLDQVKKLHERYGETTTNMEKLSIAAKIASIQFVAARNSMLQIMELAKIEGCSVDPYTGELTPKNKQQKTS